MSENSDASSTHADATAPAFLQGGGNMGALMRAFDWSATACGDPARWPQPLRTAIRLILNTGHPMYVWWGPDLLCFYNDAYSQSIGPEQHPGSLGRPAREVWEETWHIIGPQIEHVMVGGGATWQENALVPITRNGKREDVYWTYSYGPIDDDNATFGIGGVLAVCSETTQQVRAVHRADQERQRFAALFEQAPTFMTQLVGPDHRFVLANPKYLELIGMDDVIGRTAGELFPEVANQGFIQLLDQVYRTGEPYSGTAMPFLSQARRDGAEGLRYLDFVYQPIRDADGMVSGIFVVGVDVTDRTLAEIKLREHAETLRNFNAELEAAIAEALAERKVLADIVESTDAFIQVSDLDFRFLAINRASADEFEQIFGVRPKVGDNMLDLLADQPEHQADVRSVWQRALQGEEFTETQAFGAGQSRRSYEMKFNTLRDRKGVIIGAFQFVYDVTERINSQARLAEAQEHLRHAQKIESIGQLTGGIAHDFNNLLMVIQGGLSLIDRPGNAERRARVLDGMRQATERGASLSRQLLAFARRQPLKAEPVDLAAQLAAMRDLLDRSLRGDVHVATDFAPDLWSVLVDPAELELVLLNLCVNARDAMPEGGTIAISAYNAPAVRQQDLEGDFVVLSVRDNGCGMTEDVKARVFEPFYTTKEVGKGSGLGLPQVQGFAAQSNGAVMVDSAVGQGTTVTLLLPRTDQAPMTAARIVSRDEPDTPHGSGAVLLVEDDDEVASLVTEMLREIGYQVTRTSSADAALGALANGRKVDLLFSDIMMPGGMNGVDLAREARRRRPELPILLTSGYAEAALLKAGSDAYAVLRKPYVLRDLQHAIGKMLDK
jgi:PAS domain S-box-containing protein